ncbi:MAG TPA: NADH-quinone oxidoreductase subunit NuoE, partial [Alphaproteobacteria bacterium]|nr:NADH-quinone oxidoreductase subunit NuoE [Alphaproteobacteria bacterium]
KVVQRHRRWVSDEGVRDIADFLGLSPDAVDSVATFYNLVFREPVGRHVILLCDSISCWLVGHDEIRERLNERLGIGFGETTGDGRFTLLPTVCLGACDGAPAMMVDGRLHTGLSADGLEDILAAYE